jgi:23S rRNA A2030 N6-methylase RlmJ
MVRLDDKKKDGWVGCAVWYPHMNRTNFQSIIEKYGGPKTGAMLEANLFQCQKVNSISTNVISRS